MPGLSKFLQGFRLVTGDALNGMIDAIIGGSLTPITASGAVNPRNSQTYPVTKAGVAAMTLAAPTSGTDDGVIITITSNTAYAHTLTSTGLLQTGAAGVNLATFAAFAGASVTLMAYRGKWNVIASTGITFS